MRTLLHAPVATIGVGFGILAAAAAKTADHPRTTVAVFAAGAIVAELWQAGWDDVSAGGAEERAFSLTIAVQVAAILVLGTWPATLIAGVAVLVVGRLHESSWRAIALRTTLSATATLAAALSYELSGGHVGTPTLPGDLMPVVALAVGHFAVYTLLLTVARPWHGVHTDLIVATGEAGLGTVCGLFAAHHAWNLLALAPIALLIQQAYARALSTKREVAAALDTFATIVDERDPTTYRHSVRVAAYVAEFGRGVGTASGRGRTPALGGPATRPRQGRRRRRRFEKARAVDPGGVGDGAPGAAPVRTAPASVPLRRQAGARGRVPARAVRPGRATTASLPTSSRSRRTS